jgi:DNA-binding LytR/AlgR family response regulator
MWTIAICDDEADIRTYISRLIIKQNIHCRILEYSSGKALVNSDERIDIIFLDIQMDNINGIEAAAKIRENQEQLADSINKDAVIIFITGKKEYVFQAFDVSAFHFLLKPIDDEKMVQVLMRVVEICEKKNFQNKEQIFIKTRYLNKILNLNDIFFIESKRRKVVIFTDNEEIELYATMEELEQQTGNTFFRCHRRYLVNMKYIEEYGIDTIKLKNKKYNDFVKSYMRYLRNNGTSCV